MSLQILLKSQSQQKRLPLKCRECIQIITYCIFWTKGFNCEPIQKDIEQKQFIEQITKLW